MVVSQEKPHVSQSYWWKPKPPTCEEKAQEASYYYIKGYCFTSPPHPCLVWILGKLVEQEQEVDQQDSAADSRPLSATQRGGLCPEVKSRHLWACTLVLALVSISHAEVRVWVQTVCSPDMDSDLCLRSNYSKNPFLLGWRETAI